MDGPRWKRARPPFGRERYGGPLLVVACVLLAGCEGASPRASDPLCGDASAAMEQADLRLARPAPDIRLFEPHPDRRAALGPESLDSVNGWIEIVVAAPRTIEPIGTRHVESIVAIPRIGLARTLVFAPRARREGERDWVQLGWVKGERRRAGDEVFFDVPFDLAAFAPGAPVEIALSAWTTRTREQHVFESDGIVVPPEAVLSASVGAVPGSEDRGPFAFRLLACGESNCECVHAEVLDPADGLARRWSHRRLSLAGLAGQRVSLRLETQALGAREGTIDPGLVAEPRLWLRAPSEAPARTNLLLVSLDTLGAPHLGAYGYPRDTSPYIDGVLAPRGALFERAAAPATTTGPSHMTLFTALPPSVHGVVANVGGRGLPEGVPTLAGTLRDAGWATGAVTENGAIMEKLGFSRGFDHYRENQSAQIVVPEGHIEATFAAGRRFVDRSRGLPWFLFVQTYQVHYPYVPPDEYASLFEGDGRIPRETEALFAGGRSAFHPDLYDREIRYTDDRLRAFLGALEADGLLDDTLVVVLGDHGEAFFEHTYLGHGADLHRETVHVPLILAGPGVPPGRRVAAHVGLADVMPTVLELLDVEPPPGLLGRSLVPLLRGDAGAASLAARPIFSEAWQTTGVTRRGGARVDQPTLAVIHDDHKLIRYREGEGHRYALYDLAADPAEENDLAASGGPLVGERARRLEALVALLDAYESEAATRAAALGVAPDASSDVEVDAERLEKLRALGYVE